MRRDPPRICVPRDRERCDLQATAVARSHSDRNLRSSNADSLPDAIGTSAPANATNTTSSTVDPFVLAFRPATSPIGGPILVPEPSIGDAWPHREGMCDEPNGVPRRRTRKPPVRRVIRANGRWLGVGTPNYGNDGSDGLLSRTTTRPIATPGSECQRPARGGAIAPAVGGGETAVQNLVKRAWYSPALLVVLVYVLGAPRKWRPYAF